MNEPGSPLPVYLIAPEGPVAERVAAALDLPGERWLADPSELRPGEAPPGVLLIDRDGVGADAVLALLEAVAGHGEGWTPALLYEGVDGPRVRVASLGPEETLDDARARASGERGVLLELGRALHEIARARHDINNPLTSAMAETQLLLMDVTEGEAREGLETVQEQLRRIRDLVASTGHLRPPRREGE